MIDATKGALFRRFHCSAKDEKKQARRAAALASGQALA
jgi:hypothetical protein